MPAPITAIVSTTRSLLFIDRLLESKTGHQDFAFEGCPQTRVAAPVKEQRRRARGPVQREHLSYHNPVVSAVVERVYRAADGRGATVESWAALPLEECKCRWRRMPPPAG